MRLLQLRYFRDVGTTLSISKAAEMNSIPQPAMSRAIIELENELGKQLFDRVKKRLYLTQDGAIFLEEVEQMLYYLDRGIKRIQNEDTMELSGKITILLLHPYKSVMECIETFAEKYPLVKFYITSQLDHKVIQENGIDFCIGNIDYQENFNHRLCLFHSQVMVALPANHSLADRKKISLYELENEEFIAPQQDSVLWRSVLNQCQKVGYEPRVKYTCNDCFCFEHLLYSGKYVSFVPEIQGWTEGDGKQKIILRPFAPTIYVSTDFCWDDRYTLSQAAQQFLEHVKSYRFDLT